MLKFPRSVINRAKQLTTISLPKGLVCDHHFQAFIDKNFVVRGYQKVDFEFAYDILKNSNSEVFKDLEKDEHDFYENLILEGNFVEYQLKKTNIPIESKNSKPKSKKMTLEEIYKEFWEYIDDDNQEFKEFIQKDTRRE